MKNETREDKYIVQYSFTLLLSVHWKYTYILCLAIINLIIILINKLGLISPPKNTTIHIVKSTVFDLPDVKATFYDTDRKINNNHTLESDFNRLIFLILPNFINSNSNLVFIPEVWVENQNNGTLRCDGLLYRLITQ